MATSSSKIAAGATTQSIDVAAIVSSLMTSERKPLEALVKSVSQKELIVSDLANLKSKVSTLQSALDTFQNTTSYTTVNVISNNPAVITATAANGASLGSYDVEIAQTAQATKINVGGINLANGLSSKTVNATNFQITVGTSTYTYAAGNATTPLSSLAGFINSLGAGVTASVVAIDATNWNLAIQGTKTGIANKISISNLNGGSATDNGNGTGTTTWSDGKVETINLTGTKYSSGITSSNNLSFASATNSSLPTVLLSQGGISSPIGNYSISNLSSSSLTLTNDLTGLSQTIAVGDPNLNATNSLNFSQFGITVNFTTSANAGDTAAKIVSDMTGKKITISKPPIQGENLSFNLNSVSNNTLATVNGISYERGSNNLNDIVPNLTINIAGTTNSNMRPLKGMITTSKGVDNSGTILQGLSTAYNDVISLYNTLVKNPTTTTAGGNFAYRKSQLGFIDDFKQKISQGFVYGDNNIMSFSQVGLILQGDGTTKFDSLKFANASAADLQSKLASGAKVGFQSTTNNLKVSISNALKQQGSIELQTISTKTEINTLKNKQSQLVDRLAVVENNYTMRYSKLNTLLFNLNNTSNSSTSSLTALTNMNASN